MFIRDILFSESGYHMYEQFLTSALDVLYAQGVSEFYLFCLGA